MAAHVAGKDDVLVQAAPLLKEIGDWRWLLRGEEAAHVLFGNDHRGKKDNLAHAVKCECKE
jgi:hypothetical protein